VRSRLQVEDKRESFVDGLLLVSIQPTSELAETVDVDCAKLLDEHACPLVGEVDLGSERSGCRASRRRGDDCRRKPEEFVRLNDHTEAAPRLLSAARGRKPNPINVASGQAGQSAATASMSAMTARRSAVSAGSLAKRSTSAASAERRARRRPASLKAARTASDSLRPSRISTDNARSDASSRRALTIREAINRL
jgi:hypothetical protein